MSELPDLSAQKPYALDQLAQLQGKIIQLSKSMVLQRARIERCRQSDLAAARDIYAELSRTRETLVETLAQVQLFLMEMEEYALAKVSGQLRQGLAGFALMSTGYKSVYEALSRFASSLPVGQKTNAAVVGRLMNNIKLGYYPTDPDNIALLLRGIKFPEGVTTNLLDPCCGCGKALRQLAQGNNCYAYGVELDESRAEEAQTRLHRVGFGSFFHSSISREAFHLLFLNPPYLSVINESGGRSRHEKRFLIESLPALAYGGLLIYVIPYYRLTPDICRILVDNFDDLSVWRFTESEFRKFKQIAVLGIRKPRGTELQDTLWLEELASAPMSIRSLAEMPEERYALPDHPIEVNTFKGERFNQKELEQQLRRCNSFAQMMARSELDSGVKRPLLPLSISQIGLIGGSGMINGLIDGETNIYLAYCRDNKRTAGVFSRELVKETLNRETNRYEKLANISCGKNDGMFRCDNLVLDDAVDVQGCCRKAEELFELYQRCANRKQIETICVNFLRGMEATKLSVTGHMYFVPRTFMERVDIFEDFITLLSGLNKKQTPLVVNSFYIIDDAKQRDKMTEEFYLAVKKEIAAYQEKCDYLIKSSSQSPAVMERWVLKVQALEEKKRHYEGVLQRELDGLDDEFSVLKLLSQELQVRANSIRSQRFQQKAA